jgi:hypothetical protein
MSIVDFQQNSKHVVVAILVALAASQYCYILTSDMYLRVSIWSVINIFNALRQVINILLCLLGYTPTLPLNTCINIYDIKGWQNGAIGQHRYNSEI